MRERRRWERYEVAYPLESEGEGAVKPLLLIDVSRGGAAFSVSGQIALQDKLALRLFLKKKMYQITAVVVHVQKTGKEKFNVGVQFTDVSEDFYSELEQEIEDIARLHKEKKLRRHKNLTFKKASMEYLEHARSSKDK